MGILMNSFEFDGINSLDYGLMITEEAAFNAPKRVYEMISIPGRNGDLALDEGRYENIPVTYSAGMVGRNESAFAEKIAALKNAILSVKGYKRLTDTYNPDEFRLGIYKSGLEVDSIYKLKGGKFSIQFDCKPQRFLVSGETAQTFTASGSITNPTNFDSSPLLEVVGTGTVKIGSYSFSISTNPGRIYIDCDIMEAWSLSGSSKISQNGAVNYTNLKTPKIEPGTRAIVLGSGITELEITPRWWRL